MISFVFPTTTLVEMDTEDPSTIAAPDTSTQHPQYFAQSIVKSTSLAMTIKLKNINHSGVRSKIFIKHCATLTGCCRVYIAWVSCLVR